MLSLLLTCLCFTPLWLCILWQFVREPNMIHGTVCSHYILFHQCQWIFVLIKWLCSCLFDVIYSRSRRPCKCLTAARKIGNRRFCRPRRGQRYHRRYLSRVVHFPCLWNAVACAISVACFNIDRNQAMHSKYGNGKAGRGKGSSSGKAKGKGGRNGPPWAESTPQETLLIEDVATQVERVLPEQARLRMQSQLLQAEWNCPICAWQSLSVQGGVAIVPKNAVAQVVQQVGWSSSPIGIVTTESPDTLGLRGFPRSQIQCTISYMGLDATREQVVVKRWLTQLGYGQAVEMVGPKAAFLWIL